MDRVLLISMPFGSLDRQALGISLLAPSLRNEGYACDIKYLIFSFAEHIGFEAYSWLTSELPYTAFAGDWLFTSALYGERPTIDQKYIEGVLRRTWSIDEASIQRLLHCRSHVTRFIEYCMMTVEWTEYSVVGFTSTFAQNIASLALAKHIKQMHPHIRIVFGGANWEGEMGVELHRRFPFVDYVCSGESDESFPRLVNAIFENDLDLLPKIKGIVYRSKDGQSRFTGYANPIVKMDSLPVPDYRAYFEALNESTVGHQVVPHLLMETSRGCWWGAKSHCTFCGLNGNSLDFRSKSTERVLAELFELVDTWNIEMVEVVDNILDMRYLKDMLPLLAQSERYVRLFYEVKANLNRSQLEILKNAGVFRIQPGIESMSNHVLTLMRKGTSALRNVQLLKWCKEYGIGVDWNMLYGFPGETVQDYEEMLRIFPAIRFLGAPTGYGPIRLDRFSPYFDCAEQYGLTNILPMLPYRFLYPFDEPTMMRIAYYFEFDYHIDVDPAGYADSAVMYVQEWQQNPERGTLVAIERTDGSLLLQDTRADTTIGQVILTGLEKCVYDYCDQLRSLPAIARRLQVSFPTMNFSVEAILAYLSSLVANQLMVTDGKYYLSLALRTEPVSATTD